jgi:hypothetical protein
VLTGAGSFDLADCTRRSSFCICAVRVRIWVRDVELGMPRVAGAFALAFRMTEGVAFLALEELVGPVGPLELCTDDDNGYRAVGLGVVLESPEGILILLFGGFIGVFMTGLADPEASEMGGDGGVGVSETVSVVETDLVSGGVVIIGEEAVDVGEPANEGEFGAVISVVREVSCRLRSLSCKISASILRSDSSSRSRCVSIRRLSRSCSPSFISSSIMTALSIATLYFDSRSSNEEDVFRACLSKSSFCTSMSRSFSCNVRLASRSVVISFCKVFCAAPASVFACLYLVCQNKQD